MQTAQSQSSSQFSRGKPRLTGIGLVVLIHMVIVWALANGLVHDWVAKPKELIPIPPRDKPVERPPEPLPRPFAEPNFPTITPVIIDAPLVPPTTEPTITVTAAMPDAQPAQAAGPAHPAGPVATAAQPGSAAKPAITSPGMVCTTMGKPEVPAMNWSGEAVLKAVATVKAGRVVSADIRVLSGNLDPRSRRSLQAAVSSALQDSYECPGNHVFEQEFFFRVE